MAVDSGPEKGSPPQKDSEHTSPRKQTQNGDAEDTPYKKDKAYKKFASSIKETLNSFDSKLQDWADYISFLNRLLKAVHGHPSHISILPYKGVIALRLAQSLSPSLPNGVHQRALDVYAYVFSLIGKDDLARDLPLYFPGLSTTLSFGSLSVRSSFLAVIETHILPLDQSALRPALKAIVLSLLPGLEDETSEDFERTLTLIDGFQASFMQNPNSEFSEFTDDGYFWQCFFLASITSSSRSQGALAFLNRRFPRMGTAESSSTVDFSAESFESDATGSPLPKSIKAVVSPEPGLLIRCLASGLQHEQVLIQRGFLDLISSHVPLHSQVLQGKVQKEDLDKLVLAAAGIVLRRDTSLNRRLWNWFLGPEKLSKEGVDSDPASPMLSGNNETSMPPSSQGSYRTQYFQKYGLPPLVRALRQEIGTKQLSPVKKARPLRICQSLMDRWEIGGLVIPEIFLSAIDSVRSYRTIAQSPENFNEVLRSANAFFDGVEGGLIWSDLVGLMASALSPTSRSIRERLNDLALIDFTISHFNIRDDEMLDIHIPLATMGLQAMVMKLTERHPAMDIQKDRKWSSICVHALEISEKLVELLPGNQTGKETAEEEASRRISDIKTDEILTSLHDYYIQKQGSLGMTQPPFSTQTTFKVLLRQSFRMLSLALKTRIYDDQLFVKGKIAIALAGKLSSTNSFSSQEVFDALTEALRVDVETSAIPHKAYYLMVNLSICLVSLPDVSSVETSNLIELLVYQAWTFLSPSSPKFHVETVRSLWQIQQVLPVHDRQIESILTELISKSTLKQPDLSHAAEPARRFAILWSHTIQQNHTSNDTTSARPQTPRKAVMSHQRLSPSTNFQIMLSRPLFLILDSLMDESTELFMFVRGWIQTMPGMEKLFWALGSNILGCKFFQRLRLGFLPDDVVPTPHEISAGDDLKTTLYYFRVLSNVFKWSSSTSWSCLSQDMILPLEIHTPEEMSSRRFDYQTFFSRVTLNIIMSRGAKSSPDLAPLKRTALSALQSIMASPFAESIALLELEYPLVETLASSLDIGDTFLQVSLLDCVIVSLKLRILRDSYSSLSDPNVEPQGHTRTGSKDARHSLQVSVPEDRIDTQQTGPQPPPPQLLKYLQEAFASPGTRPVLDSWISFLTEIMPLYSEVIFQVLIPLVECLCDQISQTFEGLKATFSTDSSQNSVAPESTLIALINGLEQVLARAHDQLITEEINDTSTPGPTQTPGFFGNMVSGVFSSDSTRSRSATANDRLTVILSFQDTVRICYKIWAWGTNRTGSVTQDSTSLASFAHTSLRMRNRARRMLEHLFAAESLECLEVLVDIWRADKQRGEKRASLVFDLLHVLDGSRPKHTIPAIFNAIYSRANPNALDPMRQSTLTSDLADTDVVIFLVDYARTLEDDAMDEIWTDCMTFIKDVLLNPFPHRQTLPRLLEFTSILGEKVDNTNFGEQRRMRRELSDLFMRVLTATFTSRPMAFTQETSQAMKLTKERPSDGASPGKHSNSVRSDDIVSILAVIVPSLPTVLVDSDRILAAATAISTNIISPIIKSKLFPENFGVGVCTLLYLLSRLPNTQKAWKKDISDAFNDPRFFNIPPSMLKGYWLRLLRQWTLGDKERMPELLSRLTAPTTAGIMFGVGANSARLEADRKTQSNLRRIALLILAATDDNFIINLAAIQSKLIDLLSASVASSPSSVTRTEVFLVFRALVLKSSSIHLAPLWPIISIELHNALSAVSYSNPTEAYNAESILQACKLLDVLLVVAPDDFQLHEWLFITDTIDAVYRPALFEPIALVDEISENLGSTSASSIDHRSDSLAESGKSQPTRRPLLSPGVGKGVKPEELLSQILVPFFSHLSIHAFESTYSMEPIDWESCRESLLIDLCDEGSLGRA